MTPDPPPADRAPFERAPFDKWFDPVRLKEGRQIPPVKGHLFGLKLSFESRFNDAEYQRRLDTLAPSKAKRELDGQTFLAR